jgi:hypothetical protein
MRLRAAHLAALSKRVGPYGAPDEQDCFDRADLDRFDQVLVDAGRDRALSIGLLPPPCQRDDVQIMLAQP